MIKSEFSLSKQIFYATIILFVGIVLFATLYTAAPSQITSSSDISNNLLGQLGDFIAFWGFRLLGIGAWLLPALCFLLVYEIFTRKNFPYCLVLFFILIIPIMSSLGEFITFFLAKTPYSDVYSMSLGGLIGHEIIYSLKPLLGNFGTGLLLFLLLGLFIIFLGLRYRNDDPFHLKSFLFNIISKALKLIRKVFLIFLKKKQNIYEEYPQNCPILDTTNVSDSTLQSCNSSTSIDQLEHYELTNEPSSKSSLSLKIVQEKELSKTDIPLPKKDKTSNYIFPKIDLLERSKNISSKTEDFEAIIQKLTNILRQFGISVTPGEIHKGPVITRYELTPAAGVRVEKIVSLDKNIALGVEAKSVRIIAPVPGKGCVGIELPNKEPASVRLREILESKEWVNTSAAIPIVLGRGVTGEPIIYDLAKMPHLLIAGATGAGKTVCINTIIASLLFHSSPEDLRFIMVDPKIVEMQCFNNLPHMLIPVVTDPKKVPNALKWLIAEMENRYQLFAKVGVRNIANYNEKLPYLKKTYPEDADIKKIPYIICIIDELADLMMVAPGDIETCIARLAQLARAAGIHLILATQRPSVNVITGIIKANLPCRIAFKVSSKVDSRTILDTGGAESLLGQGDMLFSPPGAFGLIRTQGAFVSDDEISNIVQFLYDKNGGPKIEEDIQQRIESENGTENDDSEWDDELIPKALEIIRANDRASTSFLQRKLKIGYNRAARIMDTLRERGMVGNSDFEE